MIGEEIIKSAKYVILKPSLIEELDLNKKRSNGAKVFLSTKESIQYNQNKFFFQTKKGIVKFRGEAPGEIKQYKQYTHSDIKKLSRSKWGQWKKKNN